jgi:ring-1,2-phenylacetyl-CoA epoxidase subunit PaaB
LKSLDPRVSRLPELPSNPSGKEPLDQLGTFEVFVQPREGKPFQHEGAVHAPNLEMAFVLAKESFTRRFTCSSLWVTETRNVFVSATTEDNKSAYDLVEAPAEAEGGRQSFAIFHLPKRGKQHVHFKTVEAGTASGAMAVAKTLIPEGFICYNIWAVPVAGIRTTREEENDLWRTLPDKKFRDAAAYKGGDKLKEFLERNQTNK